MSIIKVSVAMITYNHENYIREAIEGVINQNTNFSYEILVGEDCSNDLTRSICEEYESKYPKLFKLIPKTENVGMNKNWSRTVANCSGKYIAICEGDDYWTDPNKLQTQFDIMESNSEYSFTFHSVSVKNEIKSINYNYPKPSKKILTFNDILKKHYVPTCSVFYRSEMFPKPDPDFLKHCLMGDLPAQLLLTSRGNAFFLDKKMATYRKNQNSITMNLTQILKGRRAYVYVYFNLLKYLFPKYFFPLSFKLSMTILGFIKDRFK